MERPVEVALFQRGELQSVRSLSPRYEWRAAIFAAMTTAAAVLLAMVGTAVVIAGLDLVVHGTTFVVAWLGVATGVAIVAARRAAERARRYMLGVRIEADAFGPMEVDLVRRVGSKDDYELGLTPGMVGTIEHGRSPLPIEALTRRGPVSVPLPAEGKVRIDLGASTFVISRRPEPPQLPVTFVETLRRGFALGRKFLPVASAGMPIAAVATFLYAVPIAQAVKEVHMRSAVPATASKAEVERYVRASAQRQVASLNVCFDRLPLSCHTSGYISVGMSLSKSGDVEVSWVSRSTYGDECPVAACVKDVVSGWYFEPLPFSVDLLLPIQVAGIGHPLHDPMPSVSLPMLLDAPASDGGMTLTAP